MSEHHSGSCLCGAVEFVVEGTFDRFYLCHCSYCRKDTGSAHASNLFASSATLTWVSGQDKVVEFNLPGTRHRRCFCSVCGSALPCRMGSLLVVPAGCLDTPLSRRPDAHLFHASKAAWDRQLEDIPVFDGFPA
jgi:hypothetical protein